MKFKATNYWKYDYVHDFKVGGSCGLDVFGFRFGAHANYHQHREKHTVEKNKDELTFDDGEKTLRVIGFIAQKNKELHVKIMEPLYAMIGEKVK